MARTRIRRRTTLTVIGVVTALLTVPGAAHAATTFGSPLRTAPGDGHCVGLGPCTFVAFSHPSAASGNPVASGSPVNGVITKVRIRALKPAAGSASVTFRLAHIAQAGSEGAAATAVGRAGPTVTVAGSGAIEEFGARLPVAMGDHLAIDTSGVQALHARGASASSYAFSPRLTKGPGLTASSAAAGELLVQATVEPDADGDGFGDETQDHRKPRLASLRVQGGRAAFRLNETARTSVRLAKRDRRGRFHGIKVLQKDGRRGVNTVRFGRDLEPGRYRLAISATDRAGNRSETVVKRFRR